MWSCCWWWHQYPIPTNNFLSMHNFGKVFNLPWEIIELKISNGFSNNCNIEKLLSADAIVTNIGITVHFFHMLKISIADIVSPGKINWVTLCLEIRSSAACCNISTGNIDQQSIIYMDFLTCGFDHHLSISSRHSSSTSIPYTCVISLVQLSPCLALPSLLVLACCKQTDAVALPRAGGRPWVLPPCRVPAHAEQFGGSDFADGGCPPKL